MTTKIVSAGDGCLFLSGAASVSLSESGMFRVSFEMDLPLEELEKLVDKARRLREREYNKAMIAEIIGRDREPLQRATREIRRH